MQKGKCYIVGAGQSFGLSFKPTEADFVIAADGGFNYLKDAGYAVDMWVGDADSVIGQPKANKVVSLNKEKDQTDMHQAIEYGLQAGYKEFHIYAATGGRLSHTLANIQCLAWLAENGCRGYLYGRQEIITAIRNQEITISNGQDNISVFSLTDKSYGVTLSNLKYPLQNYTMKSSYPIGISNAFNDGQSAKIRVESGTLLIIYNEIQA